MLRTTRLFRLPIVSLLAAAALCCAVTTSASADELDITMTKVGDPVWTPTDHHVFTAPCTSYEEFVTIMENVWPLHVPQPGVVHQPPYDTEMAEGVAAAGYKEGSIFQADDIAGDPMAMWLIWSEIPNGDAPWGSSNDFEDGPIIPNELYPGTNTIEMLRNGVVVETAHPSVDPHEGVDGHSHGITIFGADRWGHTGSELLGDYEFRTTLRDAAGNGWDVSVPFQVVPEPSTVALLASILPLAGCVSMLARRRKRA